jgi:hypothetical protein
MPPVDLDALAEKVKRLSPADRLRLAADLIERGRIELAQPIVSRTAGEIELLHIMAAAKKVPR